MASFFERGVNYVLKRGKVRKLTLKFNAFSEKLLLMGPDDLNAQLVKKLELGKPLDQILVDHVRATYPKGNRIAARSALQRIYESESTKVAGALAFGTFLALDGLLESAYGFFKEAGVDNAKRVAPYEFYDAWMSQEPAKAFPEVEKLLNGDSLKPSHYGQLIRVAVKTSAPKT